MAATNGEASSREPEVTLAEIRALAAEFPGPDLASATKVLERDRLLAKPRGGLGQLEDLTEWLAKWQARHPPRMERPSVAVFAGNHGVAANAASSRDFEATAKRVAAYGAGGGAINAIVGALDADFRVFELALEAPTADFTETDAMTDGDCAKAMAYGMMAVEQGVDAIVLGQVGVGGDVSAAALIAALKGGDGADLIADGETAAAKRAAVAEGLARHRTAATDALDTLRRLGGYEIAAMAGAIVAARMGRVPVLLDGLVPAAAAIVVGAQAHGGADHCALGAGAAGAVGEALAKAFGRPPILDVGVTMGEAAGAALAVHLLRAAALCHSDLDTRADRQKRSG